MVERLGEWKIPEVSPWFNTKKWRNTLRDPPPLHQRIKILGVEEPPRVEAHPKGTLSPEIGDTTPKIGTMSTAKTKSTMETIKSPSTMRTMSSQGSQE